MTRLLVGMILIALMAAACGQAEEGAETTTSTLETTTTNTTAVPETTTTEAKLGPSPGGTAVIGHDFEPITLNPFAEGGQDPAVSLIGQAWLEGVWDIDGYTLELVPEVVTELPTVGNGGVTVNDDGTMTVRYSIRDEAVWSDGVAISGDDFAFTLETLLDLNSDFHDTSNYQEIVSLEAGVKTFTYTMATPTIAHEQMFRYLVPAHAVADTDLLDDWNREPWPSAGPFQFAEWVPGKVTMVRNEAYWKTDPETDQQLPYLDEVVFEFIPEGDQLVAAFRARQVDVIEPAPASEAIDSLRQLEGDGAVVEVLPNPIVEHISFQFGPGRLERNPVSVNDNIDYRRAVAHLIDRVELEGAVYGTWEPLTSWFGHFDPDVAEGAWDRYPHDVDAAKILLDQVRADEAVDEIVTVFSTTSNGDIRVRIADALGPMFEAAGVTYEKQLEDSQLFFGETLDNGSWDLGEWAWVKEAGTASAMSLLDIFDPEGPLPDGSNYYRWGTPDSSVQDEATARFVELRDQANATVDVAEISTLLSEAEEILADQMVILPLYARVSVAAVWADEVGGFKHNPSQAGFTWNIEEWYRR